MFPDIGALWGLAMGPPSYLLAYEYLGLSYSFSVFKFDVRCIGG
jgi:hypothetical protein